MRREQRVVLAGIMALVAYSFSACAPRVAPRALGVEELVERSAKERPDWITSAPVEPGFFYATGIATSLTSLEDGKASAVQAAVQEIVNYLGIKAEVQFSETRTELTTRLVNRITSEGAARLTKGRPLELYYERYRVKTRVQDQQRFEVHVLLRIPLTVLEEEAARLEQERNARIRIAAGLLDDGADRARGGDLGAAIRRWLEAGRLLEDEWGAENLQQQIRNSLSDLASSVTLVAIEPDSVRALEARSWRMKAFARGDERVIPLAWTQLEIEFSESGIRSVETVTTDANGVAAVSLPMRYHNPRRVGVRARIDMDRILGQGAAGTGAGKTSASGLANLRNVTLWLNRPEERRTPRRVETRAERAVGQVTEWNRPADGMSPIHLALTSTRSQVSASRRGFGVEVGFLVDIRAGAPVPEERPPLNLVLVVDRSGSMKDEGKIEYAKEAIRLIARNLEPSDRLSIVFYSSTVEVLISGGTLRDRQLIDHHLEMLMPKNMTNLSAGLLEGVNQAEKHFLPEGLNRIVLLSDGLANKGVTNPRKLEALFSDLARRDLSLSAVGLGQDFDEDLLIALSERGQGNYYYVGNSEDLPSVLMEEMQGLMSAVAQNITLVMVPGTGTDFVDAAGQPWDEEDGTIVFRLGDMVPGERNLLGLTVRLPRREPGIQEIGRLALRYDAVAGGVGRVEELTPMIMEYSAGRGPEDPDENIDAIRYLQVLETMDLMELAMQSSDSRTLRMIREAVAADVDELLDWSESLDDPDMTALVPIFRDCVDEMSRGMKHPEHLSSPASEKLRRQIREKLRRHR